MPGASIISKDIKAISEIEKAILNGKLVSAICASPAVVLANNGLLKCQQATCYPAKDFVDALKDKYVDLPVVVSQNFITANGPKSAMDFSFAICKYFNLEPKF
jgi:4-methyl-5(b-hydroxyethyl)-thiazole monophosphate biosynthesis